MLIKQRFAQGIIDGKITLAFRRWHRPTVRAGGRLRTWGGVVAIDAIEVIEADSITLKEARRAGYATLEELLDELASRHDGDVYRIELHFAGEDPRKALREKSTVGEDELRAIKKRLDRFDAASSHGAWTTATLELIAERPGVRAASLAKSLGREKLSFKTDVRKLKELGLTESLEVGYRLSPRGQEVLRWLLASSPTCPS
jgi:hypothetical protein